MSDAIPLTIEQTAALHALDYDTCELNLHGTTEECCAEATHEWICTHCTYTRPVCKPHAATIVGLINNPGRDVMPVWTCQRCHRRSFHFSKLFHLHTIGGHHHA